MKENRNRNKIGLIPIFHIKAFVSTKLYRQLTSLMMSIVISTVTVLGNTTVALADKKDDVINRIIEQYENGDISRDEAKRALIRNGVTNSPIIDLNEDEDGNELATDSDLVKKLGEKDRLIDEKIRKIIEDNRDDDTSVVFAWHHEDADSIIDELSDVATKSELKKSEADDNQESKKSVGIYYNKFNKTNKSSENADSETESENIAEAVDTEDDTAVDEESISEGEVSDENQDSEEMAEDDSLDEDEENEDYNSVDEDEVFENDPQDNESEDFDSAEEDEVSENDSQDEEDEVFESVDPYAFFMNQLQADENETFESVEENEGFENNSQDEEAEVSESVNPYEFFMNQFQNEETEVSDSVEEDEVSEDASLDEEDEKEDSDSVEEDEVLGNDSQNEEEEKEENSDSVETAEADENESEDEEKKENSNIIKVDKFFEIDSYVENEDSDSENSEEETTEAETEAAKTIGILAHSDKTAIAQTAEDVEAEVDADAEIEAETETKAAKAIGILAHSDKTAIALTEENKDSAEEEKDYDVIDLSEYITVSSAVKKFHEEWIESESFDSGNKIGLTLYFSIPEDVMYDKDTRVAAYSMPEGLSSQFEGKGKVISGDETVGTYKLKKNEVEITFDTAFVKSGKSIEGALFFKGRVENKTDEDCLTIELGGTAGSLEVYKEITKTVVSEDGKVLVTATFGASTFDGDVTLYADSLDENTRNDIINAYNEKLSEEERQVASLYLYDVYFIDEEGTKIEPDGQVSVKMSFTEPVESGNDKEVKVIHVKDNDPSDIEDLTSMEDTVINENSNGEVKGVKLVADSFSPIGFATVQEADLNIIDYLSGMSITGAQEAADGWTMKRKEPYTLYLTFKETSGGIQFPNTNRWMYYTIPDGLYIEDKNTTFDVIIDNKYTISGNTVYVEESTRRLYFQWKIDDPNIEHLRSATNVKITAELTGYVDQKEVEITFQNNVTKTIHIDASHDVSISKTGYFNTGDKLLHYTLTVKSTGFCEKVIVTDTISGSNIELVPEKAITVKDKTTGESIDNAVINVNKNTLKSFTVTIPEMENGKEIEIKYRARLKDLPENAKLTFDTVGNTAKVKANDIPKEKTVDYDITKELSKLKKSSYVEGETYLDEDGNPYVLIDYEINVNKQKSVDITFIKDTLSKDNLSYASYYGDGIEVYVNDSETPISIKWSELTLKKDSSENDYSWTWRIPESIDGKSIDKKSYFRIKYQTKVYKSYTESRHIINNVETNHHETVSKDTYIGKLYHTEEVNKEVLSYDNDGIVWELSFKVPADGLDMALIKDDLPCYYSEFRDSLDPEYSITVTGLVGNETYKIKEPYDIEENGKKRYRFKIAFFKDKDKSLHFPSDSYDEKNENDGLTGTSEERIITIRYRTINNQNWIKKTATNLNITDLKEHVNKAYFFISNWMAEKSASVTLVSGSLRKNATNVHVLEKDKIILIGYDLVFSVLDGDYSDGITFVDTYDEDLSFVDPDEKDLNKDGWVSEIPSIITSDRQVIGHIYYDNSNMDWPGNNNGETVELLNDPKKHTITIKVKNLPKDADNNGKYYQSYRIRYYLKIDLSKALELADKKSGIVTFGNNVKWGDLTAQCNVDYEFKTLTKGGWYDSNAGLAKYEIKVNPLGMTLNNGKPLTLYDVFSDNQIIDISSIEVKENDNLLKDMKYHITGNTLTFENLPDSKKLTITYNALPLLTNGSAELTNTASLLWTDSTVSPTAYFNANAAGWGSTLGIKIVKYKSGEDSTLLEGAVFDLYKVTDDGEEHKDKKGNVLFKGEPIRYEDSDEIVQFVTKEKGIAEVSLNGIKTKDNEKFDFKHTYCLVESKAPEGYKIDEEKNVYFFSFADSENGEEFDYESEENPRYPKGYVMMISNEEIKYELPITGSFGINVMYLAGTFMVVLSGIFLVLRKRKANQL